MTDIRRTLLWGVFLMSLFLLWDAWNKHNGQPSMFSAPAPRPAASGATPGRDVPVASAATPTTAGGAAHTPIGVGAPSAGGEQITLRTDLLSATFDSKGGDLVRLELLKHQVHTEPEWYQPLLALLGNTPQAATPQNVLIFDRSAQRTYLAQTGLITAQADGKLPNHTTIFSAAAGDRELKPGVDELNLRFQSEPVGGVQVIKTISLRRGEYGFLVKHEIINASTGAITPQLYLRLVRDGAPPPGESSFYFTFTGPALYTEGGKFSKIDFKDIDKGKAEHEKKADNGWVGMVQHYFASAWIVPDKTAREFRSEKLGDNLYAIALVQPLGEIAAGASKTHQALLFAGPQEEKKLEALAPGLELVKDYGWFTVLAKPLFWLLDQLHRVLGNWGWAIVALVVLLKIAFYWLNASAYRSMAKMKAINPRVMELRERHKANPQQMQQEMMRIYREEKVNPLGGCLPIVVQIPFFIALYWVLLSSVEMRNAPWIGWIHDLSLKDPYYIMPLLMTVSTLFQTWLNPTPPDPVQAKMMWIMPMVFSVMFFVFPAGLVLYWLTNNLLSIAQQWFINRQLGVNK